MRFQVEWSQKVRYSQVIEGESEDAVIRAICSGEIVGAPDSIYDADEVDDLDVSIGPVSDIGVTRPA